MTREELEKRIHTAVQEYIADEETYDDNAQLQLDPQEWKVTVIDGADIDNGGVDIQPDINGMDYYDVMDLVKMSPDAPGKWEVDEDAVKSVAEEYLK